MSNKSDSSRGIGFLGILALIFITLKLVGVINWGWLWVLSPLWIPFAILSGFTVVIGVIYLIAYALQKSGNKK